MASAKPTNKPTNSPGSPGGPGGPTSKPTNKQKQQQRAERAAALMREKQRKERRRQVLTVLGVVVALALIVGGGFLFNSMRDDSEETAGSIPAIGSDYGLTIGSESAPHEIIVYEDFLCPYCGELERATHEDLEALAEEGKVRVEYRPFVLLDRIGPYSQHATEVWSQVLENDGEEVALAFHDLLYANQPSESGPFPSRADLVELAGQAGADTEALTASLEDGDGERWAEAATESATDSGLRGTPTVYLDGELFTDYSTADSLARNLVEAVQ